jgi:hypothetical protein
MKPRQTETSRHGAKSGPRDLQHRLNILGILGKAGRPMHHETLTCRWATVLPAHRCVEQVLQSGCDPQYGLSPQFPSSQIHSKNYALIDRGKLGRGIFRQQFDQLVNINARPLYHFPRNVGHGVSPVLQRLKNADGSPCPIIGLGEAGALLKETVREATVESMPKVRKCERIMQFSEHGIKQRRYLQRQRPAEPVSASARPHSSAR